QTGSSQSTLPRMPLAHGGRGCSCHSHIPQPGAEVSVLYSMPYRNPRLKHQQRVLQALRKELSMRKTRFGKQPASSRFPIVRCSFVLSLVLLAAPGIVQGQQEQQGIDQGNYNTKQSIEFGYRFVDTTGDKNTYNTFINLQQGPRLLDFSTE